MWSRTQPLYIYHSLFFPVKARHEKSLTEFSPRNGIPFPDECYSSFFFKMDALKLTAFHFNYQEPQKQIRSLTTGFLVCFQQTSAIIFTFCTASCSCMNSYLRLSIVAQQTTPKLSNLKLQLISDKSVSEVCGSYTDLEQAHFAAVFTCRLALAEFPWAQQALNRLAVSIWPFVFGRRERLLHRVTVAFQEAQHLLSVCLHHMSHWPK